MKQIKKDLQEIKNEVDEEKEQIGLATEIIKSKTEQLKRKDFIIVLLIICWFITGCYLVYLLNNIDGTVGYVSASYPNNTILITMNGHIVCSKNGVIYDTFDCRNRIAEDAWLVL